MTSASSSSSAGSPGSPPGMLQGTDWDQFDAHELALVISHWDLGRLKSIRPVRRGSRRAPKVRIESERGAFLLKRRAPQVRLAERVAYSQAVQTALVERGFHAPAIHAARDGKLAVTEDESVYEMFTFIPGVRDDGSVSAAVAAGESLGRMHEVGADINPPGPAPTGSWHAVAELPAATERIPKSLRAVDPDTDRIDVAKRCRFLRRAYIDAADRIAASGILTDSVLNHGDWHPGNLIYVEASEQTRVAAVVDFDAARREPRVMDIANAALQFGNERGEGTDLDSWPGTLNYRRIRGLLRGYEAAAEILPDAIIAALPWLMIEALTMEAVVPLAATGRFAGVDGEAFLRLVERKVRWLRERNETLVAYLTDRQSPASASASPPALPDQKF